MASAADRAAVRKAKRREHYESLSQAKVWDTDDSPEGKAHWRETEALPLAAREADLTTAAQAQGHDALVERAAKVVEDRQIGRWGYVTHAADRKFLAKLDDFQLAYLIQLNTGG